MTREFPLCKSRYELLALRNHRSIHLPTHLHPRLSCHEKRRWSSLSLAVVSTHLTICVVCGKVGRLLPWTCVRRRAPTAQWGVCPSYAMALGCASPVVGQCRASTLSAIPTLARIASFCPINGEPAGSQFSTLHGQTTGKAYS